MEQKIGKKKQYFKCVLKYCQTTSKNNPKMKFIAFPLYGSERFQEWCNATKIALSSRKRHFICHKHFLQTDFKTSRLKKTATPSQRLTSSEYLLLNAERDNSNSNDKVYTYYYNMISDEIILKLDEEKDRVHVIDLQDNSDVSAFCVDEAVINGERKQIFFPTNDNIIQKMSSHSSEVVINKDKFEISFLTDKIHNIKAIDSFNKIENSACIADIHDINSITCSSNEVKVKEEPVEEIYDNDKSKDYVSDEISFRKEELMDQSLILNKKPIKNFNSNELINNTTEIVSATDNIAYEFDNITVKHELIEDDFGITELNDINLITCSSNKIIVKKEYIDDVISDEITINPEEIIETYITPNGNVKHFKSHELFKNKKEIAHFTNKPKITNMKQKRNKCSLNLLAERRAKIYSTNLAAIKSKANRCISSSNHLTSLCTSCMAKNEEISYWKRKYYNLLKQSNVFRITYLNKKKLPNKNPDR